MITNNAISNLIREKQISQIYSQIQTGLKEGMQTLDQTLKNLLKRILFLKKKLWIKHLIKKYY